MIAAPQNESGELHVLAETDEISALRLKGEFDLADAPQILETGNQLLADDKHVILDLSQATFVDSWVINALFRLGSDARRNGRIVVVQLGTAAIVDRVIELSGIDRVLPRTRTRPEAIDAIHQLRRPRE